MSHELFELFSMLGAGVGLTALFQRAVHPLLLRFARSAANPARTASRQCAPGVAFDSNLVSLQDASGIDSSR